MDKLKPLTLTEVSMGKRNSVRTTQGFKFETFMESLDCPACSGTIQRIPVKNFGHIDGVCVDCGAGISAKYHADYRGNDRFNAPPASAAAYRSVRALWGNERLFVLAGNNRSHRFFSYVGAKETVIAPRRGEAEGRVTLKFQA